MRRLSKLTAPVFASVFAFAFACATATTSPGGSSDAGTDGPLIDPDAVADAPPAPKKCVDPPDIKIIKRNAANSGAPDDKDCDPNDTTSVEACKFGRCAGWTDPFDGSSRGKCMASCTEMNKQPGTVCYPGAICRSYANTAYCIPTDLPLCGADGGAPRSPDGGCFKRGVACTFDDDCCSSSCTPSTSGAKCD